MTATKVEPSDRSQARMTLRASASGLVAVGLAYVVLVVLPGNRTFVEAVQFAGTADRFSERLRETGSELSRGDATVALLLAIVFTVAWGAIGYYVFYGLKSPKPGADGKLQKGHWDAAWKASPGTDIAGRDLGVGGSRRSKPRADRETSFSRRAFFGW